MAWQNRLKTALKLKRTWALVTAGALVLFIIFNFSWLIRVSFVKSTLLEGGWPLPDLLLPAETADADSLQRLTGFDNLPRLEDGQYMQQSSHQRIAKPYNVWFLPESYVHEKLPLKWAQNDDSLNFICRGDDSKIALSGFVEPYYNMKRCPEPYVKGAVMARFEGSGRLARFWMTALSALMKGINEEVLRIYIDDNHEPLIQVPLKDVFAGRHEIFAPPFGAGESSYIAWYYPVVFSKKLIVTLDQLGPVDLYYHQTAVVLDHMVVQRRAAEKPLHKLRSQVREFTGYSSAAGLTKQKTYNLELRASQPQEAVYKSPGTITALALSAKCCHSPDDATLAALKDTRLDIYWDDRDKPAVSGRLGDLFAFEYDLYSRTDGPISLLLGDGRLQLRLALPMPVQKQARFVLSPAADYNLQIDVAAVAGLQKAGVTGRLYSHVHKQKYPAADIYHNIVDLKGRPGRFVATCAQLRGRRAEGEGHHLQYRFLEGDERGYIDGIYRIPGTGAEDYFNSSFYYLHSPFATRYAAWWGKVRESTEKERMSQCRFHVFGDTIDFQKSFKLDLEIGGRNVKAIDEYLTTAWYYLAD